MSKLKVIVLAITLTILSLTGVRAQQAPIFTNFTNSYAYINPGFAGLSEGVNLLGLYRQQWAGGFVDQSGNSMAPTTFLLTGDMPIRALGGGISFSVLNDQLGYEKNTNVGLGYSYHFDLGGSTIGIGVSASLLNRAVNFGSLVPGQVGDPLLNQLSDESGMLFDLSAGLFWQIPESFYVGVSGINLLESTSRTLGQGESAASFTTDRTLYFVAGYPFVLETMPTFRFVPSVNFMTDIASWQLNAGMKVIYNDLFSLGVNYRPQESIGLTVGLTIKDFVLGYAYDINTMGHNIPGSHEIALSYCFKLDTDRTPRDYRSVRYL
ncbi:MAG: PorP/SprF family type IX secretion system membrane protein [Bacteroidales bacterium]|nr:PorP/SprF family type IX secretion system membrane protein [Bacteroidales bacterium]